MRHSLRGLILLLGLLVARRSDAAEAPVIPPPVVPDRTFNITDYGAVADGITLNTAAIVKAVDACEKAGGGTVRIPAGAFLTAAFSLGSNLNFQLDQGAVLRFSSRFADYPLEARDRYPNFITANDCHDLEISGQGTIDGQGEPWWTEFSKTRNAPPDAPHMPHRPFMIVIKGCTRLAVRGITLTNSPSFHLVPQQCTDVTIDHVTIIAPEKAPNTDGMDPSGWNYSLTHCTFDAGDDCIAIKAGGKPAAKPACENFFISDCAFKHGHGMSIGGQTGAGLRHLVVQNCTFDSTGAGIRMKAPRGNGGLVEDCLYENLTMTNVKYPIYITSYYPENTAPKSAAADPARPIDALTPIWRNIRIRNLTSTRSPYAGRIIGLAEMPISDLEFENVHISAGKGLDVWNVKGLKFVNSRITVTNGNVLDVQQSSAVSGLPQP